MFNSGDPMLIVSRINEMSCDENFVDLLNKAFSDHNINKAEKEDNSLEYIWNLIKQSGK